VDTPSSLPAETAALDRARAALNLGQASVGLAELARYEAAFPRGMLRPESMVLKVEALVMAGDRARARELALAFIAAHPQSPHTGRLRSLVGR
jgi:outer membrane protein assembly factor BamD (BamD/ComL family)